jgi:hypothetical protein
VTSSFEKLAGSDKAFKPEPPDAKEFSGLVNSGRRRLQDARHESLSLEGRFDLAYNAAHSLCLAALRWHGYRSANRYLVFQLLANTLGLGPEVWRVLAKCHELRNLGEYEGGLEVDARIVADIVSACEKVEGKVLALAPIKGSM